MTVKLLVLAVFLLCALFALSAAVRARKLTYLHTTVLKSRILTEAALAARAAAARRCAKIPELNAENARLLDETAAAAAQLAGIGLCADNLAQVSGEKLFSPADPEERERRLLAESELSRVIRRVIDPLEAKTLSAASAREIAALAEKREDLRMIRRFHNIHVTQARRVHATPTARIFRLAGSVQMPKTVDLDDR